MHMHNMNIYLYRHKTLDQLFLPRKLRPTPFFWLWIGVRYPLELVLYVAFYSLQVCCVVIGVFKPSRVL